ncbi:hypothetical protein VNTUMSATTG_55850 (plasmid) [Vibrio nigripulchritudo]|uniref:hypothetical protein n=1 Tax=Vibrio nigripulchritudo TaxID=28173 RepID=UPI001C7585AC|nr:hypothetical protein [Vibrio nigripulchritudo]BCL73648.1 hypothetical protein VNTUMSATTG_55850 [Vibrio nigripulchritudo]
MRHTRFHEKIARIQQDPSNNKDFIICDAKDSDMGFGRSHTGLDRNRQGAELHYKTQAQFIDQIEKIVEQDVVDLMLMSVSVFEKTAVQNKLFDNTEIATAIRANDATDAWAHRHTHYREEASLPFRTADLRHLRNNPKWDREVDMGLYSITFNNQVASDKATLEAYNQFRREAEDRGFPHFLEVFNPNTSANLAPEDVPYFVNDCIVRTLAAVPSQARPLFLKTVYNGPKAMEELCDYDPGLIVGVLGGSSGTTRDCFQLIHDAQKYGARLALFGRKINLAEDPLGIIQLMRAIADRDITPEQAVHAYHSGLENKNIKPMRPLKEDLEITDPTLM